MPRRGLLCFVTVRLLRERGLDSARCRLLATSSHLPIIRRVLLSSCTFQASPWPPENHDCIVISLLHHLPAVQDARYESIEPRKSGNAPELLYSGRVQRLLGVPAPSKEWMIEDVFIEERREERWKICAPGWGDPGEHRWIRASGLLRGGGSIASKVYNSFVKWWIDRDNCWN